MNYLIARVSDPEQKKALPAQKRRLEEYANGLNWEKKEYKYIEFDETAFKDNRKLFKQLVLEPLLKAKSKSIVVFDKVDRLTRDSHSSEKSKLIKLAKEGKIELHFPHDHLVINSEAAATSFFQFDINVALASYFSGAIRDNVKRRFDQMIDDGIWISRAPIGYLNYQEQDDNGKVTKGIKLDTKRDYLVRKGFELRSTGMSYRAVAKELKALGLRSRTAKLKPISGSQWEEILNNPFYVGRMNYKGTEYEHNYPKIVEPWLWDKVQEVKNQRATGRTKYNSKPFLFKKLKCHECGYSITFDGPKANGMTYGKCTEYGGKHGAEWVNEELLYEQVRDVLRKIQLPKEELPKLIKEIEKNHASEQTRYASKKEMLQKQYDELDKELNELFIDRKMFKNHHDRFEKMVKDLEKRQKDILDELEDHSNGDKAFVIGASYLLDVCSRATELFDAESSKVEQKRYLIDFVLSNMTLEGEKLRFTLVEPFEAIINMQKTQKWYPE